METKHYKFAVIKIGSEVVTNKETGYIDEDSIRRIVKQIAYIRRHVDRICIVTSGAVAAGRAKLNGELGVTRENETSVDRQLYSAAGQPILHHMYERFLSTLGMHGAQMLLTKEDYERKEFNSLFQRTKDTQNIIPIVNENDAVTDEEIKSANNFGDNDRLAKEIASRFKADIFVSLTSANGVQEDLKDKTSNMQIIEARSRAWKKNVKRGNGTDNGSGDMYTKCDLHSDASDEGIEAGIIDGREKGSLAQFFRQKPEDRPGTTFLPNEDE